MEKIVVTKKYKIMNIINVACLVMAAVLNIIVAYIPMPKPLGITLSVVTILAIAYAIVFNICVVVMFFKDKVEEKRDAENVEDKSDEKLKVNQTKSRKKTQTAKNTKAKVQTGRKNEK